MPEMNHSEEVLRHTIANNVMAVEVLTKAAKGASPLGRKMLGGAHVYLYGALLADAAIAVKQDNWIGPFVRMGDSKIKPTDEFLLDHLFGIVFRPLIEKGAKDFLAACRVKAECILAASREDYA